ncbi:MAG: hypothetical protein KJO47_08600 [Gammaproteobacteria bacterium]|nr:hypothetical protein [Gammaproteobacteria bacterium]
MRNPAAQGRRDANHAEITQAFEKLGCKVVDLSHVGRCPDILVGHQFGNELVEIKTEKGTFTKAQKEFKWPNVISIVRTLDDVYALVTKWRGKCYK